MFLFAYNVQIMFNPPVYEELQLLVHNDADTRCHVAACKRAIYSFVWPAHVLAYFSVQFNMIYLNSIQQT